MGRFLNFRPKDNTNHQKRISTPAIINSKTLWSCPKDEVRSEKGKNEIIALEKYKRLKAQI